MGTTHLVDMLPARSAVRSLLGRAHTITHSSAPRAHLTASFSTGTGRPFRTLGLQQIAVGSTDKGALSELWGDVLGVPRVGTFQSEKENVDEDIHQLGSGPFAVEIDLMQPLDPEKSPKVHIPALNHIGLWVDDIHKAVEWLESQGVRFAPGGIRKGAAGHDVTFMHPKGNEVSPH